MGRLRLGPLSLAGVAELAKARGSTRRSSIAGPAAIPSSSSRSWRRATRRFRRRSPTPCSARAAAPPGSARAARRRLGGSAARRAMAPRGATDTTPAPVDECVAAGMLVAEAGWRSGTSWCASPSRGSTPTASARPSPPRARRAGRTAERRARRHARLAYHAEAAGDTDAVSGSRRTPASVRRLSGRTARRQPSTPRDSVRPPLSLPPPRADLLRASFEPSCYVTDQKRRGDRCARGGDALPPRSGRPAHARPRRFAGSPRSSGAPAARRSPIARRAKPSRCSSRFRPAPHWRVRT